MEELEKTTVNSTNPTTPTEGTKQTEPKPPTETATNTDAQQASISVVDRTTGSETITYDEMMAYLEKRFDTEDMEVKIYSDWLPNRLHRARCLAQQKIKKKRMKQKRQIKGILTVAVGTKTEMFLGQKVKFSGFFEKIVI